MQSAWQPVYPVKLSFIRSDSSKKSMSILSEKDRMATAGFRLDIEGTGDEILLCFPATAFEPLREKLYGGPQTEAVVQTEKWEMGLKHHLMDINIIFRKQLFIKSGIFIYITQNFH
jgi:flagellar motor switch protein FliM